MGDLQSERDRNMKLLKNLSNKKPVLDKVKAANVHIAQEQHRYSRHVTLGHCHMSSTGLSVM